MNKLMWWAYLHSNQTVQLKRWLGDHADYREDCQGNPFVLKVMEPFEADTREDAMKKAIEYLQEGGK
jgi:hypothetical protein